jgi:hypothetical protein
MALAIAGARARIDVPAPPIANRGFLSSVRVIPTTGHALMGVEYISDACIPPANLYSQPWCPPTIVSQCVDPAATTGDKDFGDYHNVIEGDPLVVYQGSNCQTDTIQDRLEHAERALAYGEGRLVDSLMWFWLDDKVGVDDTVVRSVQCSIGKMEADLAEQYGGVGTIVLPIAAAVAATAAGLAFRDLDGSMRSPVGTTIVAAAVPHEDPMHGFITGQITLLQGPVKSYSVPPMIRADGTCSDARALAERVYVPLVECLVSKYAMECCSCVGATP